MSKLLWVVCCVCVCLSVTTLAKASLGYTPSGRFVHSCTGLRLCSAAFRILTHCLITACAFSKACARAYAQILYAADTLFLHANYADIMPVSEDSSMPLLNQPQLPPLSQREPFRKNYLVVSQWLEHTYTLPTHGAQLMEGYKPMAVDSSYACHDICSPAG